VKHEMLKRLSDGVWLVSTEHPPGTRREEARLRIRDRVRAVLADELGLSVEAISVVSQPGQAPLLLIRGLSQPGLSISHELGFSLAAINLHGPVGVDLMRMQAGTDWQPVARDYLGPEVTARLLATPEYQRPWAFALAWCKQEARLKCHGHRLVEWALAPTMAAPVIELDLPYPYVGAIATP